MTFYEATAAREGKWWMVSIPAVDGLTQARRLSEAAEMAREYIAVSQDVPLEHVSVKLQFAPIGGIDDVADRVAAIAEERTRAAELEKAASRQATDLARSLAAADVPMRDIGAILGISHHQLVSSR
ncbi:hypothetical protein QF046_002061 [Microbacterium sp. W4I4]|uniref:hypothetical protein n=1 Tax=Microbacterium sp. W4I4 TaxID=3042295 RepID=UPI0027865038|nr:hypothetical protein [Microbacterium sp. W4I4]MDQ0614420.1 hypothetical protein [Microbacterium sp. W4I4]